MFTCPRSQLNFNIIFFQSTRTYNKGKLNGQPAAYCLANKKFDTRCYGKIILIFDIRENSPIHITLPQIIIKHTCENYTMTPTFWCEDKQWTELKDGK